MNKIGRNQICSCGSGKKYKHCCLNQKIFSNDKLFCDLASIIHGKCIYFNLISKENTVVNFNNVYSYFCTQNEYDSSSEEHLSLEVIEKYILYIEEKIIDICCKYGAYEMYFWYRRIKPINYFSVEHPEIYHELIKHVIISYGTRQDNFIISKNNNVETFLPKYLVDKDVYSPDVKDIPLEAIKILLDLYKLEYFSFYYIYLCNSFRTAIKGGKFQFDLEMGIKLKPLTFEQDYLINYYDNRLNKMSLLSKIGTTSFDIDGENDKFVVPVLNYNFNNERQASIENFKFALENQTFNFIISKISIESYYSLMRTFNEVIFSKHGFNIEDILSIIMNVSWVWMSKISCAGKNADENVMQAINILQRGYFILENNEDKKYELINSCMVTYSLLFPDLKESTTKRLLTAFDFLVYSDNNYNSFQDRMLHGFIFIKVTNTKYIVDCTSAVSVLQKITESLRSIDGKYANYISKDLENKTNEMIEKLFGIDSLFIKGEIRTANGKKEIDASFIIRDCLIVFECKSLSVSEGTLIGTINSLKFRKEKLQEYLHESESKVDFLLANRELLNKKIPSNVKYIAPLVVTSFPEYIWEKNDNLFISLDISRFMTILDIDLLMKEEIYQELITKPYIRNV